MDQGIEHQNTRTPEGEQIKQYEKFPFSANREPHTQTQMLSMNILLLLAWHLLRAIFFFSVVAVLFLVASFRSIFKFLPQIYCYRRRKTVKKFFFCIESCLFMINFQLIVSSISSRLFFKFLWPINLRKYYEP